MHSEQDRTLALAGICQAARLAQQIGRRGMADTGAMATCIHSLFQRDAESVEAVYGGLAGLASGLQQLYAQLEGSSGRDLELTRHLIALIQLERRLSANPEMLEQIARGLSSATERLEHFPMLHNNILAQLADLYSTTISTLQPRIIVRGEALHLQNPDNQHKIRALLLAGIRSARLWRQVGGRRRQLLLHRRRIMEQSRLLLQRIPPQS
jgi:high frequency lysogenization protein